jgi:hypothetical protein
VPALTIALLAPFFSGAFSLMGAQRSSCGMTCCKKTKAKSCGHDSTPDNSWTSVPDCKQRCGQRALPSGSAAAALAQNASAAGPLAAPEADALPTSASRSRAGNDFALFERPPPSSL